MLCILELLTYLGYVLASVMNTLCGALCNACVAIAKKNHLSATLIILFVPQQPNVVHVHDSFVNFICRNHKTYTRAYILRIHKNIN